VVLVVQHRDDEDEDLWPVLCDLGKNLYEIESVLLEQKPRFWVFVWQARIPGLKFIQDETGRLVLEHFFQQRPRRERLGHALKLATVILTLRVSIKKKVPEQRILMVMYRLRDWHITFEHFGIFQLVAADLISPILEP